MNIRCVGIFSTYELNPNIHAKSDSISKLRFSSVENALVSELTTLFCRQSSLLQDKKSPVVDPKSAHQTPFKSLFIIWPSRKNLFRRSSFFFCRSQISIGDDCNFRPSQLAQIWIPRIPLLVFPWNKKDPREISSCFFRPFYRILQEFRKKTKTGGEIRQFR